MYRNANATALASVTTSRERAGEATGEATGEALAIARPVCVYGYQLSTHCKLKNASRSENKRGVAGVCGVGVLTRIPGRGVHYAMRTGSIVKVEW